MAISTRRKSLPTAAFHSLQMRQAVLKEGGGVSKLPALLRLPGLEV